MATFGFIPRGTSLPEEAWQRRHRGIVWLIVLHAVGLAIFGILRGFDVLHAVGECAILVGLAGLAAWPRLSRRVRTVVAAMGLLSASAIMVHLSGGYIEAHFHFFVMLGVVFLYEDWLPYTLSVVYVAAHHGIVGTLDPASVFNHPEAIEHPWVWAAIHALFVMGESAVLLSAWSVVDRARRSETEAQNASLDLKRQLHAQEKMAALGSLVAGLAHEVRTPLTVISTNAALIDMHTRRAAPDAAEHVGVHVGEINASVDRMNALVAQLKRFHQLEHTDRVEARLDEVVKEAVGFYASAHKTATRLVIDLQPTVVTRVNPLGVQQVVLNLVANAVDACGNGPGEVTVLTFDDGGRACLVVEDKGCGMTQEEQAVMFDPLYTTKPGGMGLGLSIVRRIVADHDGDIACASTPGRGTRFRVHFSAATTQPRAPMPVAASAAS